MPTKKTDAKMKKTSTYGVKDRKPLKNGPFAIAEQIAKKFEGQTVTAMLKDLVSVLPISVTLKTPDSKHEGARTHTACGDECVTITVLPKGSVPGGFGRYELAKRLRQLAKVLGSNTHGNPIESAEIFVLMRRAR